MRYELMFPDQMQLAIDEDWPVVFAAGVLEYHGGHCCFGVDALLVDRALAKLEQEGNLVILPTFYYGPASFVVAGPEKGTVHIDADVIDALARQLFHNLLRTGFRNIHVFICHQSEDFAQGMPTDLAFRTAARRAIFDFAEEERGEGWWGKCEIKNNLPKDKAGISPLSWIKVHPFLDADTEKKYPLDHAGITETSLMMALCPDGVDMSKFTPDGPWYCESAMQASIKHGEEIMASLLKGMRKVLP